jgi:hypothetical protein
VGEIRKRNESPSLHVVIEKQVADDIDRIDKGMQLGRFSATFLHHIVEKKCTIFYALRDTKVRYKLDI